MAKTIRIEKKIQKTESGISTGSSESFVKREKKDLKNSIVKSLFPSGDVQDLLPVETVRYGLVKLKGKNGAYVKIMEINPCGFSRMKDKDKAEVLGKFQQFLKGAPSDFQIKIVAEKTDVTSIIRPYRKRLDAETDPFVRKAREDNLNLIEELGREEATSKRYFFITRYDGNPYTGKWGNNEYEIAMDMRQIVRNIDNGLWEVGNNIIWHSEENNFAIETLYRHFNRQSCQNETVEQRYERLENDLLDIQFVKGDGWGKVKVPVSSIIAPRGITPGYDYILVDGVYYSYLAIREDGYPERINPAWVNYIASPFCDVDIYVSREDKDDAVDRMERSVSQHSVMMKYQTDRNAKEDMSEAIRAADELLQRIRAHDDFYYCTIILTVRGNTYEELVTNRGMVINTLRKSTIFVETVYAENEKYFRMTMPLMLVNKSIFNRYRHNMTTLSVSSMYPFDDQRLRDENGMIIGTSTYGGRAIASFNNFDTHRYNNANIGIFGPSGSGKTYFSLMLARRLRLNDVGVMFVLPVKGYEYRYAVETLGGQFIDFSGGTNCCVNLFDIPAEEDLDAQTMADLEITARSRLQQKLIEISTFFELLLNEPNGINREAASNLDTAVVELYERYGINSDNNSLFDEHGRKKICPTIGDFYDYIKDNPDLKPFASVLRPFIKGGMSNFNGQTNIDLTNKMIAFDVSNNSESYQPVLIFLALNCCYGKMRENRKDKYALFIDEGWKMMTNHNSAAFINELVKIVRGYAGSAVFATQNLTDVYSKEFGESIISNMQSKFILKIGDGEEELNKTIFKLTNEQFEEVSRQRRGQISLIANREIYAITTATSKIEDATYTTDPGKVAAARKTVEDFIKSTEN